FRSKENHWRKLLKVTAIEEWSDHQTHPSQAPHPWLMKANLCFQAVEGAGALKILKAKNLLTKSLEPRIWPIRGVQRYIDSSTRAGIGIPGPRSGGHS